MARYRLRRPTLGFDAGTTIASDYFAVLPGDVLCPALCAKPDINIMIPLDVNAQTCFAAVGVDAPIGWEPPKESV